ncbi:MAG: hypothetical protein V7K88_28795 [Nostoc sp.]|uniref:hypothetical protein n=1 Tax=Nostoc sp. TaxID=1180 RepID=UPI002FF5E775
MAQIFGEGATQDATTVTIQKSALIGLVPNVNNRAKEILAAIIKTVDQQFEGWLTDPAGNAVLSPGNLTIDYDNSGLYQLMGVEQWEVQVLVGKIRHNFLVFSYSPYAD